MAPVVEIRGLHKNFDDLEVLKGIDMDVMQGEAVVLLGSSGSGKSTLLRVSILWRAIAGRIRINGDLVGQEQNGHSLPRA